MASTIKSDKRLISKGYITSTVNADIKMANKSVLLKQYRDLVRNIKSFTDGQASLKEQTDSDSLSEIFVTFNIKSGPYRGAVIDFSIDTNDFPSVAPTVTCLKEVYHPNIDFDDDDPGVICLNLFEELWSEETTLEDVVQGLLFLFYHANIEDPLSLHFSGSETQEEFERNVRLSLRGKPVNDCFIPRLLPDDYESDFDNEDEETTTPVVKNKDSKEDSAEHDSDIDLSFLSGGKATSDGVVSQSSVDKEERVYDSATNVGEASAMTTVQPLSATAMVPQYQENSITRNKVFDILTNFSAFAYATMDKLFTKHVNALPTIIESSVDIEVR